MSRLFFTERGRVLLHANEELARWRWARKLLRVDRAPCGAQLWLFVRPYRDNRDSLRIDANGKRAGVLKPDANGESAWQWRSLPLRRGAIRRGLNEIVLRSESRAMNSWMLGIEPGHANPKSFLSYDRGRRWQNQSMGAAGVLRGEYLIRLRCDDDRREPPLPKLVYENPKHARVRDLAPLIPLSIRQKRDPWQQVLALRTWVAKAWTYEAFGRSYSPLDPWTVFAWKRDNWGHGSENPIAMCVHYGMIFSSLAASLGHVARGISITQDVNSPHGHFMTEIWDDRHRKWIAHDASYDLHYEIDQPLSTIELADEARQKTFRAKQQRGPGFTSNDPRLLAILNEQLMTGRSFKHVGVWRLNDVISHPPSAPPSHGSVSYCETDFIWYLPEDNNEQAMFPYRTSNRDFFARALKR
ncbi:MAG TPA: transglutaminase domain-containing protein [Tepidisphaeraceae bacterium]|jgi:hypothetical protein|nr:transglutaminase domain-containing protein [Tepidisphaeraceae bacterium]